MPKIIKTIGICLNSQSIRQTSKLLTFYTRHHGKINLLAKGARNPKSKFGAALELFSLAEIIFYKKELKSIYTLSTASLLESFTSLTNLEKFYYANEICELILRSSDLEDPNPKIFDLLLSSLRILNQSPARKQTNYNAFIGAFYLKTANLLGYKPELKKCLICGSEKINAFSIKLGGVICNCNKHPDCNAINGLNHIKSISYLLNQPISKSISFNISKQTLELIQNYLFYHLENVKLHSQNYHFQS